jgi:hypothetical protein
LSDPTCGANDFGDVSSDGSSGCAWSAYLCPGYGDAIAALWTACAANDPTVISAYLAGGAYPTAAECASPNQTVAYAPPVVTDLQITSDCWLSMNPLTGTPSRDQQFTAFSGTTSLAGSNIVITESVTTSPGGSLATGIALDPATSETGGVFNDQKGLGFNQTGTVTLYQSFTVSVNGGTPYSVPIVLANGTTVPYLTFTMSATYNSFWSFLFGGKLNYNVVEYGQGKNQLPPCPSP